MPRGPNPKSNLVKLVTGTAKKNRLAPKPTPSFVRGVPTLPKGLSPLAIEEWNRIVPDLVEAGVIGRLDRTILAAYVSAYALWREAEAVLAETIADSGMLVSAKGTPIANPLIGIAAKAMTNAVRYAIELGLTPGSRTRVTALPEDRNDEKAAKYFV